MSPVPSLQLEFVPCGVCGTDNWHPYASGKDYEYETSGTVFQMVCCQECGNVYLNPRPVEAELSRIYPPNYYAYNYDKAVHPIALQAKAWLDLGKVKSWVAPFPKKRALRVLDVGCGNGRYLTMLHRLGLAKHQLFGVEMDEEAIDRLNREGYQGFYGRLEDVARELPDNYFDVIVMLQVLEHVANPAWTVRCLAKLLRPGGQLVLETPNREGWDARLFRQGFWGGYHFPRHWNLFDRSTLTRLANDAGLDVRQFAALPSHAFWILSYHHWLLEGCQQTRLASVFNPLQNVVLLSLFTGFDLFRAKLGFWTSNVQLVAVKPRGSSPQAWLD
ncbi:MAG: class I SAM-dependent methyltransferase [Cyanobacteria bacterium SID2]|nr:class I SAM-dependent methyltransferase [Cyanobacteria bacterium SID2]MBP0002644.1 class I SAM-dependent methyltransferase [Cyanobacteria bacterium SBC]